MAPIYQTTKHHITQDHNSKRYFFKKQRYHLMVQNYRTSAVLELI